MSRKGENLTLNRVVAQSLKSTKKEASVQHELLNIHVSGNNEKDNVIERGPGRVKSGGLWCQPTDRNLRLRQATVKGCGLE